MGIRHRTSSAPLLAVVLAVASAAMLAFPAGTLALSCVPPREPEPFAEYLRYVRDEPDEARHATLVIGVVGEARGTSHPVQVEVVLRPGSREFGHVEPSDDGSPQLRWVGVDETWGPEFEPGRWALVLRHGPTDGLVAQLCAPHVRVTAEQAQQLIDAAGSEAVIHRSPAGDPSPPPAAQPSRLAPLLEFFRTLLRLVADARDVVIR